MGLTPGWHIDVTFVSKLKGNTLAQMEWAAGYQTAEMEISEAQWNTTTPEGKDRAIIHELRHLVYAPASDKLASYCGYETHVWKAVNDEMEKICDSDAGVFMRVYRRRRKQG
jgi:hypothetical protein